MSADNEIIILFDVAYRNAAPHLPNGWIWHTPAPCLACGAPLGHGFGGGFITQDPRVVLGQVRDICRNGDGRTYRLIDGDAAATAAKIIQARAQLSLAVADREPQAYRILAAAYQATLGREVHEARDALRTQEVAANG